MDANLNCVATFQPGVAIRNYNMSVY